MQSENLGNEIIDVKINKKKVTICFKDIVIEINDDTYSHFYIYRGKILSEEDISDIESYQNFSIGKEYALSLLNRNLYTEKEIYDKLCKKKINVDYIGKIMAFLVENHYVNDDNYINEKMDTYDYKNYGKKKILDLLFKSGIKKECLDKLSFDEENEFYKAKIEFEKCFKNAHNKSYSKKTQTAYNHLLTYGYENELANKVMNHFEEEHEKEENSDEELLKIQLRKYVTSHHLNIKEKEQRQKALDYFIRKGFKYDLINKVLGGFENE